MAKKIVCFIFFVGLTAHMLQALPPKNYRLIWSDEFNKSQVDTTVWTFETGDNGWGNNELQYYTQRGNADLKNGLLTITARKTEDRYTSARMITRTKRIFTYGYIEIRAKLPKGKGTWPALWLLGQNMEQVGWPACGELDIMEHVGKDPGMIHCSVHNLSGNGQTPYTGTIRLDDPFDTFHLYAIDWNKNRIRFLVDNKPVYTYAPEQKNEANWPFDKPMYIIFNIAVGGNWGGPVDDTCLPQSMTIDYIRVYR